jgi:RES domain-containing protein
MLIYRITSTRYTNDLSGEGAKIYGGRWNHVGTPCIYAAATRALALLELTVHVKMHLIPLDLSFVTIEVPDHSTKIYKPSQLPVDWKSFPHPKTTRDFGTDFLNANKFLIYQLPSVVVEEEMNYIINPGHPDIKMVEVKEVKGYQYDKG